MEDRVFRCYYELCNKVYKTKYTLARHINSEHLKIGTVNNKSTSIEREEADSIEARINETQHKQVDLFLLSRRIIDTPNVNLNFQTTQGTLPILPLVDNSRKVCPTEIKLPVMLHLLNSVG
ncbi:unnamed protein product [Blepharisma stoltei]|uniref:C2H2-type domain-containing protein n=1 Tax=Blepharisma stoltei TaxID=1481888 RepID=A0AAU9KAV6_9CILI|nr:unnamed protein product [Blepharisma stoltei]